MGILQAIDTTGDTKVEWDRKKPAEVEAARAMFDKLKNERYMAYEVKASGKPGRVIYSFDPEAEQIIMRPPMVGG